MADAARLRAQAWEIADEVLFPAALAVDAADRVPAAHLDLLAAEGFYGCAAPPDAGGFGMDFPLAAARRGVHRVATWLMRNKAASAGVGFARHVRTSLTTSSLQKS